MTPSEEWRPVVGYEDAYEVSNLGRIRSVPRTVRAGRTHRPIAQRELRLFVGRGGYLQVTLQRKTHSAHSLVTAAFLGPCPDAMQVCHNDGDQLNNRADNLRYDTASANHYDTVRHGQNRQASKTHCPQGHPYDETNTGRSQGNRRCRTCHRERERNRRKRE